ncbi:MAG: alpha/beta fold hydrolase [Verrucomicrobiaceae bacterium]
MKRIRRILRWLILATFVVVAIAWLVGSSFLRPSNHTVSPPPKNLPCEAVSFLSESGSEIHGWFVKTEQAKGAVLLLHGSGGDRTSMLSRVRFLRKAGYSCLTIDQRCNGESIGTARTFGWLESLDAIAAVQWLHQHEPGLKVVVIGSSLGGASALLAKEKLSADAIIAEGVYGTLREAIWNRVDNRFGGIGANLFSPLLSVQVPLRLGLNIDEISPAKAAASCCCALFVIHGENDRHAHFCEGKEIYEACPHQFKQLWCVKDVGHVDLHKAAGTEYERRVLNFIDSAFHETK